MSSNFLPIVIITRRRDKFWLGVVRHAQVHPKLVKLSAGTFCLSEGIVQSERFVVFFRKLTGMLLFFLSSVVSHKIITFYLTEPHVQ